jgi:hypothetical protein
MMYAPNGKNVRGKISRNLRASVHIPHGQQGGVRLFFFFQLIGNGLFDLCRHSSRTYHVKESCLASFGIAY